VEDVAAGGIGEGVEQAVDLGRGELTYNHLVVRYQLQRAADCGRLGDAMSTSPRTGVLQTFLDAFNAHDVDAIMECFTDDCVMDMPRGPGPGGRRLVGKEQVREGVRSRFEGIPDVHYGDDVHWRCGDRGVSEWTLSGTQRDGKRIEVRGCDLLEFEGEKIRRKNSFWKIVE
jgi:ketosteroid isomerase-like protein